MISSRASARVKNHKEARIFQTSFRASQLCKSKITKAQLLERIDSLRSYYDDIEPANLTLTRDALINTLCEHRRRFFDDFPDILATIEAQLVAETVTDKTSTRGQRAAELQLLYFQLTNAAREAFS